MDRRGPTVYAYRRPHYKGGPNLQTHLRSLVHFAQDSRLSHWDQCRGTVISWSSVCPPTHPSLTGRTWGTRRTRRTRRTRQTRWTWRPAATTTGTYIVTRPQHTSHIKLLLGFLPQQIPPECFIGMLCARSFQSFERACREKIIARASQRQTCRAQCVLPVQQKQR